MAKKKLLVVLGSGSSVSQGMPSTEQLGQKFCEWSSEWLSSYPTAFDCFGRLWEQHLKITFDNPATWGRRPQFEMVWHDLAVLESWLRTNCLRRTIGPILPDMPYAAAPLSACVNEIIDELARAKPKSKPQLVVGQAEHLMRALGEFMREKCRRAPRPSRNYAVILALLREEFDIGIYNLNYDNRVLCACPGLSYGFDSKGTFGPAEVHSRVQWDFNYHLHGSVHLCWKPDYSDCEWRSDLPEITFFPLLAPSDSESMGAWVPRTTLIGGGEKLEQLLRQPYQTFFSMLVKHVYQADAILLGGYGFSDNHVNAALKNRMRLASSRPPVLVLDRARSPTRTMSDRNDSWARELRQTLHVSGMKWPCPGQWPGNHVDYLNAANRFDVSSGDMPPVAVWYNGFEESLARETEIVDWLNGDVRALAIR